MPFKSKAQMRKFGAMLRSGEISEDEYEEWRRATPNVSRLPERVGRKKNRNKAGKRG